MSVPMDDPYDLQRFVDAQLPSYARALDELKAGQKETHWIWYVFPQIDGLGRSETAKRFAIKSLEEASAYLVHPVLGPRLEECAAALLAHEGKSASEIMGSPDDMKLRSSMTLFERAAAEPLPFAAVLDAFYDGERDPETLTRL